MIFSSKSFFSSNIEETQKIAKKIAQMGIINLGLIGELGSGKTQFTKGYFSYYGVPKDIIVSPSFNILNIYKINTKKFYHIDLYRYKIFEDDFGFWEIISNNSLVVIEWADRLGKDIEELDAILRIQILGKRRQFILEIFK